MKLSIIIPVLDDASNLRELLISLQPLREHGHEVIVVDGGSNDDSVMIGRKYADLCLGSITGRARQMNTGAARANGDVFLFVHCDSRLPGNASASISSCLEQGYQWGRFTVRINNNTMLLRIVSAMMNFRTRYTNIVTGDQCLFVSRKLFEQTGGFADIALMEDVEISRRLRRISPPAHIKHTVTTSARRWLKNGTLRTILSMWQYRFLYWCGVSPEKLADRYYPGRKLHNNYAILVFAKPPVRGQVKTRLAPVLSEDQRSVLHEQLVFNTLSMTSKTGFPVELYSTQPGHEFIREVANRFSIPARLQEGNNLGERMMNAVTDGLSKYKGVVLVGTDCPQMDEAYIREAVTNLERGQADIVFGPAEDGGYVLLACRRLVKPLFHGIDWGSTTVLEQSLKRLEDMNIPCSKLETSWDLDRPEDYMRYCKLGLMQSHGQAVVANA